MLTQNWKHPIIIFVGIQHPSFPWVLSLKGRSHALNTGNPTCDQQCSTTDGSRKDFAHHGAILNIQAFNLPHLFYLYVQEINVLYIWYSIHVHLILYMYTGIRTCCFSDSFQSQKTLWLHNIQSNVSCACRWPQEQYALPALALISDDTLIYWLQDCWNFLKCILYLWKKTGKDLSIDIKAYIKQSNNEGNSWEVFWMHKLCKGKMWVRSHMSIRDYCFIFPRISWYCLFTASQCC